MFEILVDLYNSKHLAQMAARGIVTGTFIHQFEVYMWIDARMTADKNLKITKAAKLAAVKFDKSERYIWRAIKTIK